MTNVLGNEQREQIPALGHVGWSLRRIQAETGIRRETASAYLKAAGLDVRPPGRWGRLVPAVNYFCRPVALGRGEAGSGKSHVAQAHPAARIGGGEGGQPKEETNEAAPP